MQAQVSSVIRCNADCIGVAALLPVSVFKDSVPLKQLTAYWRKQAKGSDSEAKLCAALDSSDAAILISERVVNAPAELATPLVAGIVREQQQCAASGDRELLPYGNAKQVLHCALAYIDSGTAPSDLGAVPVTSGHSSKTEVCPQQHPSTQLDTVCMDIHSLWCSRRQSLICCDAKLFTTVPRQPESAGGTCVRCSGF